MSDTIARRVAARKIAEKTEKTEQTIAAENAEEETHAWRLTEGQREAEKAISQWFFNEARQIFVLSGYAGTGKTFLLAHAVKYALKLQAGEEAVFVAPTGKAAAVLVRNGTPAGTVHSLIYTLDEDDFDVDENGEIIRPDRPRFVRREKIDEKIKLIVVDEASMVDETLLNDVLAFGVKCLFCGDKAQLPPVRGENIVMAHVDYSLTEIVRQAADNPILAVAQAAREGKYLPYGNYGGKVLIVPRAEFTGEKRAKVLLAADQVICGRNTTRNALNEEIRAYKEHEGTLPEEGEKLVCTLNDWEKPLDRGNKFFLVNGVIGFAKNVRREGKGLASMDFFPDFLSGSVRVPFEAAITAISTAIGQWNFPTERSHTKRTSARSPKRESCATSPCAASNSHTPSPAIKRRARNLTTLSCSTNRTCSAKSGGGGCTRRLRAPKKN